MHHLLAEQLGSLCKNSVIALVSRKLPDETLLRHDKVADDPHLLRDLELNRFLEVCEATPELCLEFVTLLLLRYGQLSHPNIELVTHLPDADDHGRLLQLDFLEVLIPPHHVVDLRAAQLVDKDLLIIDLLF